MDSMESRIWGTAEMMPGFVDHVGKEISLSILVLELTSVDRTETLQ